MRSSGANNFLCGSQEPDSTIQAGTHEIDLYCDWPDDEKLRGAWNRLVAHSPRPNVFMTWEWASLWWKWFGVAGNLRLLIVRDSSVVVVIMPLHIQRTALVPGINIDFLRLVGDGSPVCPDFLGPIMGCGEKLKVIEALGEAIVSCTGSWRAVRFADILPESPGLSELLSVLERCLPKETERGERCPFLPLPDEYETFLGGLGASQRESIRRRLRKAKKRYAVRLECVTAKDAVATALDDLLTIYKNSERGKRAESGFNRGDYAGFHKDVIHSFAGNGWLRLIILYFDDVPVAFLYGYQFAAVFYFYQTGYDLKYGKDGAGSIVLQAAIERAIAERCTVFEFLRGSEKYKYHYAKGERQLYTMTYWRSRGATWAVAVGWKTLSGFARKIWKSFSK